MNRLVLSLLGLSLAGSPSAASLAAPAPASAAATASARAPGSAPHNVILFVADGLRGGMVRADTAPTLYSLKRYGVWFRNSHSLFPTLTTPNASALATGHYLGDTGDFGNSIYTGYPVVPAQGSPVPFLESDPVLGDVNAHFSGNFLDEESVLAAARSQGYSTAAVGKLGPVAIQDVTARDGNMTIIVDDSSGHAGGIALSPSFEALLAKAGLPAATPGRGANGNAGDAHRRGTDVANVEQQKYFVNVATRAILPAFKAAGRPFVLVYWSRDPDGTQHNQGDSPDQLVPGINGPSSLAAIRNADDNLAALLGALEALGLDGTTDVVVTADHGFSTISKQSKTSHAAQAAFADVPKGELPPGFLAIDLAGALGLPLFDPDAKAAPVDASKGQHPSHADGLIGPDPDHGEVLVAANGGSDLIYLTGADTPSMARKVVAALLQEDYTSGIFVDDALGPLPGTLPLSAIRLTGAALTPRPSIVVNFASTGSRCALPTNCAIEIADTTLQQGQGMHGSFSRADTFNFMAALGPDFRRGFIDPAPVSNADLAQTIGALLGLTLTSKGSAAGRIIGEARTGGAMPRWTRSTLASEPSADGRQTLLHSQAVGDTQYFDAAGFAGRTLGLAP